MTKLDIIKIKVDKFDETIDSLDTRLNRLHWRRKQETINIFKKFMTPDTDGIEIKNISDRRMEFILLNDKYSSMTIERINQEDIERASWDDTLVDFKAYSNGLSLKNVEELKKRSELQVKLAEQFEDFKDDMIAEVNCVQEKYDGWKKELTKRSPVLKAIGGGGLNPTTLLNKGLPSRKKFKRGGHVKKKNIDGIAKKGKTRGTII